jgi:hypothetical protein
VIFLPPCRNISLSHPVTFLQPWPAKLPRSALLGCGPLACGVRQLLRVPAPPVAQAPRPSVLQRPGERPPAPRAHQRALLKGPSHARQLGRPVRPSSRRDPGRCLRCPPRDRASALSPACSCGPSQAAAVSRTSEPGPTALSPRRLAARSGPPEPRGRPATHLDQLRRQAATDGATDQLSTPWALTMNGGPAGGRSPCTTHAPATVNPSSSFTGLAAPAARGTRYCLRLLKPGR